MKDVIHVDLKDKVVGHGGIDEAFKKGLAVRIIRIFIVNDSNEILLQKRSAKMSSSPLKWDQSVGGHVDIGETYLEAAKREMQEEMGIKGVKLKRLTKFYIEDEYKTLARRRFNVIYYGKYNGKVTIDNDEVSEYKWVGLKDLEEWLKQSPEDFTHGIAMALSKVRSHLI